MFGYVTAAPAALGEEAKIRYRGWYCGLCRSLGKCDGQRCRLLLTYDMAFLAMLLSSVYDMDEEIGEARCIAHPFKPHKEIYSKSSEYAADMNVILSYYKFLDDWKDDRSVISLAAASAFRGKVRKIEPNYPRQCETIASCLNELGELEKSGEMNPDLPANCFGRLMGELFAFGGGEFEQPLREFGHSLGRFIYIMDAACDLIEDLKKERYNPLVEFSYEETGELLRILGGDFMRSFQRLPLTKDTDLMGNILCVGVWTKYEMTKKKFIKEEEDIDGKESL